MTIHYNCEWCGKETQEVEYVARAYDTLMVCPNCAAHLAPYWYEALGIAFKSLLGLYKAPESYKSKLFKED